MRFASSAVIFGWFSAGLLSRFELIGTKQWLRLIGRYPFVLILPPFWIITPSLMIAWVLVNIPSAILYFFWKAIPEEEVKACLPRSVVMPRGDLVRMMMLGGHHAFPRMPCIRHQVDSCLTARTGILSMYGIATTFQGRAVVTAPSTLTPFKVFGLLEKPRALSAPAAPGVYTTPQSQSSIGSLFCKAMCENV